MSDNIPYRLPYLADDPHRDPQETAFLRSIIENPDDDTSRLIFADWLEENAYQDKAAFVRLEVEMSQLPRKSYRFREIRDELKRLDKEIGGKWSEAFFRPSRLLNCGKARTNDGRVRFAFECPKRWADLKPTDESGIRYCDGCRKRVHFCSTKDEAEEHAIQGHCVAVDSVLALRVLDNYPPPKIKGYVTMGDVMPDEAWVDPNSPYYRWAVEFFTRRGHPWLLPENGG